MNVYLAKYGTGSWLVIHREVLKRAAADFGTASDFTPATGDVKIRIDGGSVTNIATLPTFITSGNTAYLEYVFSDAELQGKRITVTLSDSATKAVEDDGFEIHTFGHASALYPTDYSVASTAQTGDSYARIGAAGAGLTAIPDSAGVGTLLTRIAAALTITGGKVDVNDKTGFGLVDTERVKLHATQSDYAPAKAGDAMTLTSGERTAVANEVEAQIIDDTDSERVLQAIVDKIAAANPSLDDLTLSAIASAVRTELEGTGTTLTLNRADLQTLLARATEARLAELDAGNLPSDVDTLKTRIGTPAGASVSADLAALPVAVDTQLSGSHGSGAWGSEAASGDYTVTITAVDDDTDAPLDQVSLTVRHSGGQIHHQERTDVDGEVSFPADDGTYTVTARGIPGYNGVADQAFTVSGANQAVEVRLAPIASVTPEPGTRIVRIITIDSAGNIAPNVPVSARLSERTRNSVDQALIAIQVPATTSNSSGIADLTCITEDQFEDGDGVYVFRYANFEARTSVPAGDGALNLQEHLQG